MGRGILLSVVVVAGCSGSPDRVADPVPPDEPVVPAVVDPPPEPGPPYALPQAVAPPVYAVQCQDFGRAKKTSARVKRSKTKHYDFSGVALSSTVFVPTVAERPRYAYTRTQIKVRDAIRTVAWELERCWRWARAKDGLDSTRVELAFRVDPWGRVSDVDAGADDLAACVEEQMTGALLDLSTTWTRVSASLHFWATEPIASKKKDRPKRPGAPAARSHTLTGKVCVPIATGVPDDEVVLPVPIELTDGDEGQNRTPCGRDGREADKRSTRQAIFTNLGAFASCHAAARGRDAQLAGDVVLTWRYGPGGMATDIEVSGVGDQTLHDCMRDALAEVWFWFEQDDTAIEATFPFTLGPPAAAPDDPDALLEARDPEAALAIWEQRLRDDPDAPDACSWRAGVLRGMLVRAPWVHDARVEAALDDLVADVARLDPPAAARCLEGATEALDTLRFPTVKMSSVEQFASAWREPYGVLERLRPIFGYLDREYEEDYLLALAFEDPDAAIRELERVAGRAGDDAEWASWIAGDLRRSPDVLRAACKEYR